MMEVFCDIHLRRPNKWCIATIVPMGAAVNRVPSNATAFFPRQARYVIQVYAMIMPNTKDSAAMRKACDEWLEESYQRLLPYSFSAYAAFTTQQGPGSAERCFGDNLPRLRQLKAKWDPNNFFCHNENILPATEQQPGAAEGAKRPPK